MDEAALNLRHRDSVKVVALAARLDRRGNLVRLSRRENEDDARGWFLECLEQGVERLRCQHMHFIDDVDLIVSRRRRKFHGLAQVTNLVDAAVRRRIDLEYIH